MKKNFEVQKTKGYIVHFAPQKFAFSVGEMANNLHSPLKKKKEGLNYGIIWRTWWNDKH